MSSAVRGVFTAALVVSLAAWAGELKKPDTSAAASAPVAKAEAAPLVVSGPTYSSSEAKELRVRLGVLGGLNMQKTDVELAASLDLLTLATRLKVFGELALGVRPLEASLIPSAGVRYQISIPSSPKLHPWVSGSAGVAVTFMRGGVAMAIPISLGVGGVYEVSPKLGVGLDLGVSVGPLLAPFSDLYASVHGGLCGTWSL